jgi:hypothetical protein
MARGIRGTISHTLNTRAVEMAVPAVEEFELDGVRVRIQARVPEGRSFATVACSGTAELDTSRAGTATPVGGMPFVSRDAPFGEHGAAGARAWERIEPVLIEVGTVLRWRYGIFGDDALWTSTEMLLELNGRVVEFEPMPRTAFGDGLSTIDPDGLQQVATMVGEQVRQPLAHEMWREAWNLQYRSPRSSLVIGVAAAEVGFKHLVALLVPPVESLVEHIPSPPLRGDGSEQGRTPRCVAHQQPVADVDHHARVPLPARLARGPCVGEDPTVGHDDHIDPRRVIGRWCRARQGPAAASESLRDS